LGRADFVGIRLSRRPPRDVDIALAVNPEISTPRGVTRRYRHAPWRGRMFPRRSNCEYEEVEKSVSERSWCRRLVLLVSEVGLVWPWAGRSGAKKRRARPLDGPSSVFRSDDQTATALCLALPWTGLCGRRGFPRLPGGNQSLGPGLL